MSKPKRPKLKRGHPTRTIALTNIEKPSITKAKPMMSGAIVTHTHHVARAEVHHAAHQHETTTSRASTPVKPKRPRQHAIHGKHIATEKLTNIQKNKS